MFILDLILIALIVLGAISGHKKGLVGVVVGFMPSGKVRIDPCFMPNRFTRDKNTDPVICEYDSNYKGRNFREPHTIAIMNTDNVKLVDTSKVDDVES